MSSSINSWRPSDRAALLRALAGVVLIGCRSGAGEVAEAPAGVAGDEAPTIAVVSPAEGPVVPAAAPVRAGTAAARDEISVVCARAVRCGTIGRSQLGECQKGPGASRLTLVWGYDDKLGIPELVEQGRLKVVPGADQGCLEFLESAPCEYDLASAPPGCHRVPSFDLLAPGVPPGGKCTRWDECIDGYCTAQAACEGVCVATVKAGAACGGDTLCGDDTFCWEGSCRARVGVGAECGGHWQWCQDGLFCDGYRPKVDNDHYPRPEVRGRCSAGKQVGEGCVPPQTTSREICASGLYCDWGADAPVCRVAGEAGASCGWLEACTDGLRCAGLTLGGRHPAGDRYAVRTRGTCTPTLDAGDACDPQAFVSACPGAMVCDVQTRVCRSTGHTGDPCVSSWITPAGGQSQPRAQDVPLRTDSCFSSHYCEVATRTCQPQRARGQRCTPQEFGVEDEPCFLGKCDARTRRCVHECK